MASFPYVDFEWTKKELKAECYSRGMHSYARLSKHHLIELLNDDTQSRRAYDPHSYPGPPGAPAGSPGPGNYQSEEQDYSMDEAGYPSEQDGYYPQDAQQGGGHHCVYDSWTVRELKNECWRRGLRSFDHLDRAGLLGRLHQGDGAPPAWPVVPPPRDDGVRRRQEMLDAKGLAGQEYASKAYAAALQLYTQAISFVHEQELAGTANQFDRGIRAVLLGNRAAARVQLGDVEGALSDCEEACRVSPGFENMTLLKARIHAHLNQWEPSIESFRTFYSEDDIRRLTMLLSESIAIAATAQSPENPAEVYEKALKELEVEDTRMHSYLVNREAARRVEADARVRREQAAAAAATAAAEAGIAAGIAARHALERGSAQARDVRGGGGAIASSFHGNASTVKARSSRGAGSGPPAAAAYEHDRNTCIVCLDNEVNCTLVPCGHHCCCIVCAAQFEQCPVCRADVDLKIRTFSA